MKTALYLAVPALLLSQLATGQHFRLGLKAGVNYSKDRAKYIVPIHRILGINGGVAARYSLTEDGFWSIQSELLYSAKGVKLTYNYPNTGFRTTKYYHRNYLDLPILAKIYAKGLTFGAGPQISYLLNFEEVTEYIQLPPPQRRDFHSLQLGYVVGIGYELPSGPNLTLRYCDDITKVFKEGVQVRNSAFQAQLGYMFGAKQ